MTKEEKALELVKQLAELMTPEEEFESRKVNGIVEDDGIIYDDVDEMLSDLSDERLMDAYGDLMDFVRAAKEIVKEGKDDQQR